MNRHMMKAIFFFTNALLACIAAMAQTNEADALRERFNQYQVQSLQEKIFVHTDKSFYLSGEIIWFKLYCVDESFNKPSGISKVAYVEVISDEQKAVMQAKISLEEGAGNGSLIIPSSIASGNYKLRSYTSRMKNFSADFYFEQDLTIINTLKSAQQKTAAPSKEYHVDLFPEGGNLVNNIESVVAFKVTDQYGNGVKAKAAIINGKDTVARAETLQFGMGNFSLLPAANSIYRAVVKINDTTIVKELPQVYDNGYVMSLAGDAEGTLTINVNASSAFNNLPVYLFVHSRHLVKEVLMAQTSNGKAVFKVNKSKLGDGISHLTVFNAIRQPVCERLYFKRPANKLVIVPKTQQAAYNNRDKIDLALMASDKMGAPVAADMSVAVFMTDSLQTKDYENIQAWLLLQSELAGKIESPGYYFTDSSVTATTALNNLLLTQGWRRFKWEDVLAGKLPSFEFVTENEGPVISGVLTDKRSRLPKANVLTTLSVPGDNFELRSALSKTDGGIRYNVNNFYSNNEIILETVNAADSAVKISIGNPFSEKFSSAVFPQFALKDKWKDQLLSRSINAQADNAYVIEKKKMAFADPIVADTNVFYGKTEKRYYLDDYTRFITMEEVMKEYVIDVRVRKQTDGYQLRVVNAIYKSLFEQAPLVLIDGVPVSNVDKIIAFDPLKIKRIDVALHRHFLGPLVCDGIISYKTYNGDLAGFELDPNAVVVEYDGLQRQREFYSPVYENSTAKESRIPDLRNLLYWSPSVKTIKDGKQQLSFYTSDLKGNFMVVVQGLTADGLAGSGTTAFTVNK